MNQPPVERLELHPRLQRQPKGRHHNMIWAGLALLTVIPLIYIVPLFKERAGPGASWETAWEMLWAKVVGNPVQSGLDMLVFVAALLQLAYLMSAQKRERLILTRSGIEYQSPLPDWLQFLRRSWKLSWNQVRELSLRTTSVRLGPESVTLELLTGAGARKLTPFYWVDPVTYPPESPWRLVMQLKRYSAEAQAALIDKTPLMHTVQAALPNVPVKRADNLYLSGFAIEKNPSSLAVTVVFLLLVVYALIDGGFIVQETYVQNPPYAEFALVGVVAGLAAWFWMMRGNVPMMVGLGIAFLTGAGAVLSAYPGALRVNALTDTQGLGAYAYTLAPGRGLQDCRCCISISTRNTGRSSQ